MDGAAPRGAPTADLLGYHPGGLILAPLVRYRDPRGPWRSRARKALDSWAPSPEMRIAVALEDAHREGIKKAAAFLDEKGQPEIAALVRRLADDRGMLSL